MARATAEPAPLRRPRKESTRAVMSAAGVNSETRSGGTDAAVFAADGQVYLAVSNSLTPDIRFREDTVIYRLRV